VTDERRVADWQEGAGGADPAPTLEPWIIGLLACPVDRGEVRLFGSALVCDQCGRRYPVRSGIARMVSDEAAGEQKF
jgi:uncharacterized protein YbaR (Trm112 family)